METGGGGVGGGWGWGVDGWIVILHANRCGWRPEVSTFFFPVVVFHWIEALPIQLGQ